MSRVLIVFNSPGDNDSQDWDTLMNREESRRINDDVVYVFRGRLYLDELGRWRYRDISNKVDEIMENHTGSECAVLLHTQIAQDITELSTTINKADVAIQRFSTAVSPIINYEAYIQPFCNEGTQEKFGALWGKIQKKSPDTLPHLIALSILCQGYLAAHEQIDVPKELKGKVKSKAGETKKKDWWTSALGTNNQSTIEDELKAVPDDEDIKKENVRKLITAIYTNGDPMPNGNLVAEAYSALKSILQGK